MATRSIPSATARDTALSRHMSQTFNYMMGGVALSGLVAWLATTSPALMQVAVKGNLIFMLVWLGFGFFMHKMVFSLQPTAALAVFAAFSALTGFSLAPLALVYTGASITTAFMVAAIMFGGTSLYGYTTNRSLSGMGTFLVMGSWGLLAFGLVTIGASLFGFNTSGMSTVFSLIAVPLFAAITAWEVNQIKETFQQYGSDELLRSRLSILSAASLYMNFVTMFINLLQLIGDRR